MSRKGCVYLGNPPGENYKKVGELEEWEIYFSKLQNQWIPVKFVAKGQREFKANYWLTYNVIEQRLANGKCAKALNEKTPELGELFLNYLIDYFDEHGLKYKQ